MKSLLFAALLAGLSGTALADAKSEYNAAKKEIDATYKQSVKDCGDKPKPEQSACKSQAKTDMQVAQAEARKQRDAALKCSECGVVTAVEPYEVKGEGSALGAVAGGLLGGVLGHQVGGGTGKTVATIAGTAAGAYGGYKTEEAIKTQQHFEYTVKLYSGKIEKVKLNKPEENPEFKVGDKVKLQGDSMVGNN